MCLKPNNFSVLRFMAYSFLITYKCSFVLAPDKFCHTCEDKPKGEPADRNIRNTETVPVFLTSNWSRLVAALAGELQGFFFFAVRFVASFEHIGFSCDAVP